MEPALAEIGSSFGTQRISLTSIYLICENDIERPRVEGANF